MTGRGERGPTGDHGQPGEVGPTGDTGPVGATGARGEGYSSWLTRNVVKAYVILAAGVVAAFVVMGLGFASVTERIDSKAMQACEAGNDRSRIQREDYVASRTSAERADLTKLLGLTPEQAAEVRRLSVESTDRRIAALPFLDCRTGRRLPAPPP